MIAKRVLDLFGGTILLLLSLPILFTAAILIRFDSNGPIFFNQKRLGQDGKVFKMYKFRSMVENAEQIGTGLFSYESDTRITRVGAVLRRSSIDELPQLLNVIIGSMSLVGPRPAVTYELGDFRDFGPELRKRFKLKPGITGLAQITGRNEIDWDQKILLDNQYIDNFMRHGVREDFSILLRTVGVVLSMHNTIEKRPENE